MIRNKGTDQGKAMVALIIVLSVIAVVVLALGVLIVLVTDTDEERKELLSSNVCGYVESLDETERMELIDKARDMEYPVNWPMLWIVVKRVNADGKNEAGKKVHVDVTMSDREADYLLYDLSARFSDRVREYTDGLVNVEITPLQYDEVNYLNDDLNCLEAESFDNIKDMFPEYNSVMCIARYEDDDNDLQLFHDWLGLGCLRVYDGNYSFSQVKTDGIPSYKQDSYLALFDDNPVPEEGTIHEWLHSFEDFETVMMDCDGNPDEAQKHGYECMTSFGANGFYEYYRDLLNGRVWDENKQTYVGMNEDLWRTYAMLMDMARGKAN